MADQNVDCGWRGILPVKYKNCSLSKRHVYYWLGVFPDGSRFCINVPPKETVTIPIVAYAHEGPFNNYC